MCICTDPNVIQLVNEGYSVERVVQAWIQMKINNSTLEVKEDHPQFKAHMIHFLHQMNDDTKEDEHSETQNPCNPSLEAPKPMYSYPGQKIELPSPSTPPLQSNESTSWCNTPPSLPNAGTQLQFCIPSISGQSCLQQQYMNAAYQQSMPIVFQEHPSDFSLSPQNNSLASIVNYPPLKPSIVSISRNVKSVNEIVLDDIKTDRIFLDFSHPNVSVLYSEGYSKQQILKAYYVLKNCSKNSIKPDHEKFVDRMHITIDKCRFEPERQPRVLTCMSSKIDMLWQNFICCCCFKLIADGKCSRKKNCFVKFLSLFNFKLVFIVYKDSNAKNEKNDDKTHSKLSMIDNLFYVQVYIFLITDFAVRIYPSLLFGVIFQDNKYFCALMLALGAFSYASYFYILDDVKGVARFKSAVKYFWVGWFSCSYWFLSTMHLSYLECNVSFIRLMNNQSLQLLLQLLLCVFVTFSQYIFHYETWEDFRLLTEFVYPAAWVANALMIYPMVRFMKSIEKKLTT